MEAESIFMNNYAIYIKTILISNEISIFQLFEFGQKKDQFSKYNDEIIYLKLDMLMNGIQTRNSYA